MLYKGINYDDLTFLPTSGHLRRYIRRKLSGQISEDSMCLLLIDVDEFKYVNDALGYELADELIVKISERLISFAKGNIFLSRHFGVQFAMLLEGKDEQADYIEIIKEVFNLFDESFRVKNYEIDVRVTIGASIYESRLESEDTLIDRAQSAMRSAKLSGKNRFEVYNPSLEAHKIEDLSLMKNIRKIL